jgi:hypothetical protein
LHSLLILKIIIFLKRLIFCISFCAFSILTMSKLRVNAIIFIALILYTFFVFFFFLIYVINFIFLINRCFESAYLIFILIIVCAINNELYIIFAYIFAFYVFFLTLFTFSNRFVIFFNLFNIKIISIRLFFAKNSLNLRVNFLIKIHYLINVIIEIILNAFFS